MPINYNNGKIYKVINPQNEIIYIGSTAQEQLCDRFKNHKHKGNGNKIILLENYPCNCKQELIKREQELIEQFDNLLNIRNAFKSVEYHKEYRENNKKILSEKHKKYYENHKDKIKEKHKKYYENNQDKIKLYRENNKDKLLEQNKVSYKKNKEKISEKHKIIEMCECGCKIRKCDISRHKKTKKHIKLMETK